MRILLSLALAWIGANAFGADGFTHLEQTGENAWTLVGADGQPFVNRGIGWVSPNGPINVKTKKSAYREMCRQKYAQPDSWEKATLARAREWGFNTFGSDSSRQLRNRGFRHTILLRMGAAPATWKRHPDDYICPHAGGPCSAFPNVFSPKFPAYCDEVAAKMCAPNRDDRDLTGYFIDNELAWWGGKEERKKLGPEGLGLVDAVLRLPAEHTARAALEAFAEARGEKAESLSPAAREAFVELIAEKYFSVTCAAIRKADPNHLVLGCRFAGIFGCHRVVWRAAGRHCDVVTANMYPTVDFRTGAMTIRKSGRLVPCLPELDALQAEAKRPIIITEWSFPSKDTGHPCRHGAGMRVHNQGERARAIELFVRNLLSRPYAVGYDFFMWHDMPNPGNDKDYAGEDCNYGLVNEKDEPYALLTDAFARVNRGDFGGWEVTVDGRPLALRKVRVKIDPKNEPLEHLKAKGEWLQYGSFSFEKPVEVRVRCARSLKELEILPAKFGVTPTKVSDHEVAFVASKPFHLSFLPEGRTGVLHLFASMRDNTLPDPHAANVKYFGPGEHHREKVTVGDGETLFVDEGAVLHAHLEVRGKKARVCGLGTISGADYRRHKGPGPFSNAILKSEDVRIEGVTFADPYLWTVGVKESRNVVFDDVKVIGCNMINDDGIDVINSSDITIRRSFVRTQDDNICVKGLGWRGEGQATPPTENIVVEGCEVWTDQANNFRIGFESDTARMKGITVRDVDVLRYSPFPRKFEDIWCHAVFKIQPGGGLAISDLDIRDIRVNSDGGDVAMAILEPRLTWVGRPKVGRVNYTTGGTIRNCRFADISVTGRKDGFTGWLYLKGRAVDETVSNVVFDGLSYFGETVRADSPCVKVGDHVKDVRFLNGDYTVRGPEKPHDWLKGQRVFTNATELIQGAIDRAFLSGGGRVSVKRGYYPVRGLRLRSNVTLYLEEGAVLQGSRDWRDYEILKADTVEPVDFEAEARKCLWRPPSQAGSRKSEVTSMTGFACRRWNNGLIRILNAHDVAVMGDAGSVIDGNNSHDPEGEEGYRGVHGISVFDSTNVVFRGFTIQHTGNWAIRMQRCADVLAEKLTIKAGHDGFHIRGGDRVRVRGCHIDTGDDGVAGYDNRDMVVSDCDIASSCSAFRIGGRDILVENCRVKGPSYCFRGALNPQAKRDGAWDPELVQGRRTMATFFLYFCDQTMPLRFAPGNIVFRNCEIADAARFIRYNFGGETWQHGAPLADVTFENCHAIGLTLPLALNGQAAEGENVPLVFTMKECSLSFNRPQTEVFSAINVKELNLTNVSVTGAYSPLVRYWDAAPKLTATGLTGLSPEQVQATAPFACPMR